MNKKDKALVYHQRIYRQIFYRSYSSYSRRSSLVKFVEFVIDIGALAASGISDETYLSLVQTSLAGSFNKNFIYFGKRLATNKKEMQKQ